METFFVCCKQKLEMANFRLFSANGKLKNGSFFPWLANDRGQQRYTKNVTALYVIAFGLSSERNFKKQ
jgi:hypothetical protein